MKKYQPCKRALCLCLAFLLALSLAACKETDEQNSDQPTASIQPTTAPTPTPPPIPYTDVAVDAPYYDAVVWAYKNGIASDGETFGPADACTRGQVITFLWRAKGSPEPETAENPFSDVSASDWFYQPALWAYENGVATGTTFNPGNPCTNGEALTFLWRAEGKPMAVAASDAYYARPLSWAETNGQFAEANLDPAAPCSRADLMSCLYWAEVQWTSAEEVRALQAEYKKIISQQKIRDVHGTGLIYADYIDIDGSEKPGLLTVGIDMDSFMAIVATVYADIDGHAGKYCEQVLPSGGTFTYLDIYQANGKRYLGVSMEHRYEGMESQFFKVENGTFVCSDHVQEKWDINTDSLTTRYIGINGEDISEDEYRATVKKYTKQKELFSQGPAWWEFGERGILPDPGIQVNGTAVKLSAKPYYSTLHEDIMVPLRDVLEAMGVAVYVNSDASVILASTKSDTLVITYKDFSGGISSTYYGPDKTYKYSMNDGEFQKSAIEFTDGKAFLPLQTIVSLFGATAEWDGMAGAMQITSNIPDSSRMSQDELKKMANFDIEQASWVAINSGHKGSQYFGEGLLLVGALSVDSYDDVRGGLVFKNGKAVWTLYAVTQEESTPGVGGYAYLYRVDVASDGTVTAYPNEKAYMGAGQT